MAENPDKSPEARERVKLIERLRNDAKSVGTMLDDPALANSLNQAANEIEELEARIVDERERVDLGSFRDRFWHDLRKTLRDFIMRELDMEPRLIITQEFGNPAHFQFSAVTIKGRVWGEISLALGHDPRALEDEL